MKYLLLSLIIICGLVINSCSDSPPLKPNGGKKYYKISITVSPANAGFVTPQAVGPPVPPTPTSVYRGPYKKGQTVILTGYPAKNYVFEKWAGGVKSDSISLTITDIDKNYSLTAVFQKAKRVHSFHLTKNGVTVVCNNADFGTYDIINGVAYTKRKTGQITPENAATVCTSGITDMSGLFRGEDPGDISSWDVSHVTNMRAMFGYGFLRDTPPNLSTFNQDISYWNVRNVTDMDGMFEGDSSFNQNIENWNVSSVQNMSDMFHNATAFNQPIGNWDVSHVANMSGMFAGASSFNQDLSRWDVSHVTEMGGMAHQEYGGAFGGGMFEGASSFNQDLSGWCVKNIPSEPKNFSKGSALSPNHEPIWGTCPEK